MNVYLAQIAQTIVAGNQTFATVWPAPTAHGSQLVGRCWGSLAVNGGSTFKGLLTVDMSSLGGSANVRVVDPTGMHSDGGNSVVAEFEFVHPPLMLVWSLYAWTAAGNLAQLTLFGDG